MSSYEFKFMTWCDRSASVVEWGSETIIIPYQSPVDNQVHRYYIDNWVVIKDKSGQKKKYLVEVKPMRQTRPPVVSKHKKKTTIIHEQLTWEINQAKWKAAKAYCYKYGMEFILLTEEHLNIVSE